ncbi:putative auxin response factor 21 [Raphanus sativus]|nr:putative auxin response factor 21 [Raphanus sativus]
MQKFLCCLIHLGENGESRVGIRKAAHHQQDNIHSSLLSKESMHHGIVATALNTIKRKCMLVVFYKPRSSQFLVNFHKFIDGVNNKFSIGSKFFMKFEGRDFKEIRYHGTIVNVRDFSTHWNDSEWRSLEVQWDGSATIPRPDKVSPWEIEHLTHSSNTLKSGLLKHKRQSEIREFGSNMWVPTLTQGQEVGHSSRQPSVNYSFPTMSKPNYNEQMVEAMKEASTTTVASSYRLFGVDLTVRMEGGVERTVDLTVFDGYNELIAELERLFDIKGTLLMHNQWKIVFINTDGDMILLGDDPWLFFNTAKEIFICSKIGAKIGNEDNRFSEGDLTLTATILPPDVNNN